MGWQIEVQGWIESLQEELDGLCYLLEKIQKSNTSADLVSRLVKVADILKESLKNVIKKCEKLLSSKVKQENKFQDLRDEYFKAMENVENLHNTVHTSNLKPHYIFSTFASRKRSLSRKQIVEKDEETIDQRPLSAAPLKKQSSVKTLKKANINHLQSKIKKTVETLKKHRHSDYEETLRDLKEENLEIRKKIGFLREETRENFKYIEELKSRIESLEERSTPIKSSSDASSRPRLLLKGSN